MTAGYRPKDAAAVILARPLAGAGFEIFVILRGPEGSFPVGTCLIPGAAVEKADRKDALLKRCYGLSREKARQILGADLSPDQALGHWVAAIRGLFEEVGVLFCLSEEGGVLDLSDEQRKARINEKRWEVIRGSMDFLTFLESEKLLCDAARLSYFARWLIPESCGLLDARFYLAPLPRDQSPLPNVQEITESFWLSPERALELCREGRLPCAFPVYASLRRLADFDSLDGLLAEYQVE